MSLHALNTPWPIDPFSARHAPNTLTMPLNLKLTICTHNVNGLVSRNRTNLYKSQLSIFTNINIFAFQETHSAILQDENFSTYTSLGSSRSAGCTTLILKQFLLDSNFIVEKHTSDTEGRILIVTLKSTESNFWLDIINVYAPNSTAERKFFSARRWLPSLTSTILATFF